MTVELENDWTSVDYFKGESLPLSKTNMTALISFPKLHLNNNGLWNNVILDRRD